MKKQLYKRLIACALALALVLSFSASAFATAEVTSASSVYSVPWSIWYKISDLWKSTVDEKTEAYETDIRRRLDFMDNYMIENPGTSSWQAMKAYDEYINNGGHLSGHFGGSGGKFGEITEDDVEASNGVREKFYKLYSNWLITAQNNFLGVNPVRYERCFENSDGYKVQFYVKYNPDAYFAKFRNTLAYRVIDPYGSIKLDGNHWSQHYGYSDEYASEVNKWISRLKFDWNKITMIKENGETQEIINLSDIIPDKSGGSNTEVDPGVYNPNIPDYYKQPTSDSLDNPIYFDPVTNNYYNYNNEVVNYNDVAFEPNDEQEQEFDKLYNIIKQFQTAQIGGNVNIMQLLTDILSKLGTLDSSGSSSSKDYTDLLNEINASIISLSQNMTSSKADLSPVISSLESLKQVVKEISVPNYTSKLNQVVDALDSVLKKLDVITALLGVDVATNIFDDLTDDESKKLDAFASVATALLNILPTAVIGSTIVSLQSVFLTNSPPSDLTVTYQGEKITALSADMFATSAQYIDMFKIFVSALLIYGWLLMMRQRISDVFT